MSTSRFAWKPLSEALGTSRTIALFCDLPKDGGEWRRPPASPSLGSRTGWSSETPCAALRNRRASRRRRRSRSSRDSFRTKLRSFSTGHDVLRARSIRQCRTVRVCEDVGRRAALCLTDPRTNLLTRHGRRNGHGQHVHEGPSRLRPAGRRRHPENREPHLRDPQLNHATGLSRALQPPTRMHNTRPSAPSIDARGAKGALRLRMCHVASSAPRPRRKNRPRSRDSRTTGAPAIELTARGGSGLERPPPRSAARRAPRLV